MGEELLLLLPALLLVIIIMTAVGIKIVPMNKVFIVEKLGVYDKTLVPGIHFIVPFVYRVAKEVEVLDRVYETNKGTFRTYDDQSLTLILKVTYQVVDPKLYHYGFNKDLYKVQEIGFDKLRHLIIKNTVQDVKLDLLNLESQMKSQLTEIGRSWGMEIKKAQIII
jgi:regulator of protease activity HflC (stomatin/prohibitin superfamily)